MNSKKIKGPVHYSVRFMKEREETELAIIIAQKAAERAAIQKAALLASAPTNQDIEDLFNWLMKCGDDISCLFATVDNHDLIFLYLFLECTIPVCLPVGIIYIIM